MYLFIRLNKKLNILTFILMFLLSSNFGFVFAQDNLLRKNLDPFVEKAFTLNLSPGMAIAVVKNDKIVYTKYLGFADIKNNRKVNDETLFYIASTTKSFTAFAATLLNYEGRFDLYKPISHYLTNLKLYPPLSPDSISILSLLTHTHGIDNEGPVTFRTAYTGDFTDEQLLYLLSKHKSAKKGTDFNYGNLGYNILGLIMKKVTGTDWKKILKSEIFKKIGMDKTYSNVSNTNKKKLAMPYMIDTTDFRKLYYVKSDENMHAAGGNITTALDLAKWLIIHINNGKINGKQIFPESVVTFTHEKKVNQSKNFGNIKRYGWALGWDLGTLDGDTLIHKFGGFSGFRTHVSFIPSQKIGVVVFVNGGFVGGYLADLEANYIYDVLLNKPHIKLKYDKIFTQFNNRISQIRRQIKKEIEKRKDRQRPLPYELNSYQGIFNNADMGKMEWTVVNGNLEVKMGKLWSNVEVFDSEKNKLRVELIPGRGQIVEFKFKNRIAYKIKYSGYDFINIKE